MFVLHPFITRTMYGKAMRAISMDLTAAACSTLTRLLPPRCRRFVAALCGNDGGGITEACIFMGFVIGIKAFTSAVGGIE